MNKAPFFAVAATALIALAACQNKPEEVTSTAPDPMASALANAAPKEAPPSIAASVTFRCQPGNTLLYVDFFTGDKMATIKEAKTDTPKLLKAAEAGQPYEGDGYKISGDAKAATITLADGSTHNCKA